MRPWAHGRSGVHSAHNDTGLIRGLLQKAEGRGVSRVDWNGVSIEGFMDEIDRYIH